MPIIFVVPPLPPTPMPYGPGTVLQNPHGQLNQVPLNKVDDYGVEWLWSAIDGWDAMEAATNITQRTGQDGAWAGVEMYGPRFLTLSGAVWSDDASKLRDAHDRFMAAVSKQEFILSIDEHGLERFVTVRRAGKPEWIYGTELNATWSCELIATDPRKYSTELSQATINLGSVSGGFSLPFSLPFSIDAVSTTDTITASNLGNFDAPLTLRFQGPVVDPVLLQPTLDRQLKLNATLDADDFMEVFSDTHRILLGGTASRLYTKEGDWLYLPPGSTELRFLAANFDPLAFVTVTWRHTWI